MKNQEILEPTRIFLAELLGIKVEEIEIKTITQIDMTQLTVDYVYKGYLERSKTITFQSLILYFFKHYNHLKDIVKLLAWDKPKS